MERVVNGGRKAPTSRPLGRNVITMEAVPPTQPIVRPAVSRRLRRMIIVVCALIFTLLGAWAVTDYRAGLPAAQERDAIRFCDSIVAVDNHTQPLWPNTPMTARPTGVTDDGVVVGNIEYRVDGGTIKDKPVYCLVAWSPKQKAASYTRLFYSDGSGPVVNDGG